MIDIRQLECFCAVVRSGSFSKASAVLAMGQPALSRQVRKLEMHAGSQLLYRNGRGVALTPSGTQFYAVVSDLLAKLKSAYNLASDESTEPAGNVTLGLPASMGGLVGAPVLQKLRARWPRIKLQVIDGFSGHVHEWLLSGRVDLAILHDARHTPAIVVEHLLSEELFLVGRETPPFVTTAGGDPVIALPGITSLPLFVPSPEHGLRRQLNRVCLETGIVLSIESDVDSLTSIKELVRRGAGYTVLPIGCVYTDVADGALKAWRLVQPCVVNTMVLAAAQNRPFTSAMREVRTAIYEEISALKGHQTGWNDRRTEKTPPVRVRAIKAAA